MSKKDNYIIISPDKVNWGFHAYYIIEEDGMLSWCIPSFEIYFSSPDKGEGDKRAVAMVSSFINYWIKRHGFRSFLMKILKLGYKPASHAELIQLLNRRTLNARLNGAVKSIPQEFAGATISIQESSLAIAV